MDGWLICAARFWAMARQKGSGQCQYYLIG